jgi:TRAP-type C4-dicarboxylate transport system permease small subunit
MSYLGAISIMGMALLTGVDVVGRYFFNKPVQGGFEMIELLMAIIVACGIAVTTAGDDHISVDSLFNKLPSLVQRPLRILSGLISTLVFAVLAWQGFHGGIDSMDARQATPILGIPVSPFQLFLTLGFLVSFVFSLFQAILLLHARKRSIVQR